MALDFGKLNFSVSFNPTSAFPLDARSYFESYAEAEAAAKIAEAAGSTNSVYYYGQTVVVVENGMANFYIIQPNKTLQPVTGGGNNVQITINPSLFEYNENGQLTLKGFASAEAGQYFSVNENGEIIWVTPDTYTKEETDEKISKAIAAADHLKRKIVSDIDEAREYVNNNDDADQYIYMVPTGFQENDDKYDEYVVIKVADVPVLEKVGSWEVDLKDYALKDEIIIKSVSEDFSISEEKKLTLNNLPISKITDLESILNNKVNAEEGYTLLSPDDQKKLAKLVIDEDNNLGISGSVNADNVKGLEEWLNENAGKVKGLSEHNLTDDLYEKVSQSLYITSVEPTELQVNAGKLSIVNVDSSKITGLQEALNTKADKETVSVIQDAIAEINSALSVCITRTEYEEDLAEIRDILTWKEV